jgi:hypothetical protein
LKQPDWHPRILILYDVQYSPSSAGDTCAFLAITNACGHVILCTMLASGNACAIISSLMVIHNLFIFLSGIPLLDRAAGSWALKVLLVPAVNSVKALIPSGEFITTAKIPALKNPLVQELVPRYSSRLSQT